MLKNIRILIRFISVMFVVYEITYIFFSFIMIFALSAKRFTGEWFEEWKSFIRKTKCGWREYK